MKNLTAIKSDLQEVQKNFNPEKSTYKVFDELIKNDYTTEEMINILSKIRGIHKYPDNIKIQFLGIINNLNILKEQEAREKLLAKKQEEKQKQEENTRELKDIIDSLEQREEKVAPSIEKEKPEEIEILASFQPEVKTPKNNDLKKAEPKKESKKPSKEIVEDDGKMLSIILGLLIVICIIVAVLLLLIY